VWILQSCLGAHLKFLYCIGDSGFQEYQVGELLPAGREASDVDPREQQNNDSGWSGASEADGGNAQNNDLPGTASQLTRFGKLVTTRACARYASDPSAANGIAS
jgi:hypothetical protein